MRRFLIQQIERAPKQFEFTLIGGLTGCQKTHFVKQTPNGIDLEGAAYHRGSSFGAHATPQSNQINFENLLAIDLLAATKEQLATLVLEDEGRFIGSVDIPKDIYSKMRTSPIVVIQSDFEDRLQNVLREYVVEMQKEFADAYPSEQAFSRFSDYLINSLARVQKRLGLERWRAMDQSMREALSTQERTGDTEAHLTWIAPLLQDYYDPMYTSQLKNREEHIIFRGDQQACREFLSSQAND